VAKISVHHLGRRFESLLMAPPNVTVLRQPRSPSQMTPANGDIRELTESLGVSGMADPPIFRPISLAADCMPKISVPTDHGRHRHISRSLPSALDLLLGNLIANETDKWGKVVKFAGIKLE
jgi:hypothetical protein